MSQAVSREAKNVSDIRYLVFTDRL